jgi:hypothetical protein
MRNPSRSQAAALERTSASNVSFGLPAVAESSNSNNNDSLLAELEIEFAEKVGQMRELSDRLALRLEANFRCEMLKLPKAVRNMSMREFCVSYGGDVDEAMKQQAKKNQSKDAITMPPPAPKPAAKGGKAAPASNAKAAGAKRGAPASEAEATPGAKGGRSTRARTGGPAATPGGKGMATPAGAGTGAGAVAFTPRVGETPRLMKGGEAAFTANGSPINVLNTVKARAGKRNRPGSEAAGPSVLLAMADGREIDLANREAVADLEADDEAKGFMLGELERLQAQVAAHIKALKGPNVPEI